VGLHRGYWEAKDSDGKLDSEIKKKIAKGYPLTNTIFEDRGRGSWNEKDRSLFSGYSSFF
jgi:hypothetical protein